MKTFEMFLQYKFGKMGIYKDSDKATEMFDSWLLQLDPQEWLDYGQEYATSLLENLNNNENNPNGK